MEIENMEIENIVEPIMLDKEYLLRWYIKKDEELNIKVKGTFDVTAAIMNIDHDKMTKENWTSIAKAYNLDVENITIEDIPMVALAFYTVLPEERYILWAAFQKETDLLFELAPLVVELMVSTSNGYGVPLKGMNQEISDKLRKPLIFEQQDILLKKRKDLQEQLTAIDAQLYHLRCRKSGSQGRSVMQNFGR